MSLAEGDEVIFAFRRNVVVAASAGTGKTHRLTALYVLLALGLTSMGRPGSRSAAKAVLPDRAIATTFSRAAAREIARRVERSLLALADLASPAPLPFEDVIRSRYDALGEVFERAELAARARRALAKWGDARIDTIHGTARRIVLRHGPARGETRQRVLDEVESQEITERALGAALGRAFATGGAMRDAARALVACAGGAALLCEQLSRWFDRLDEEGLGLRALARADHVRHAAGLRDELRRVAEGSAATGALTFRTPARELLRAMAAGSVTSDLLVALFTGRMPSRRDSADDALDGFRKRVGRGTNRDKAEQLAALLRDAASLVPLEGAVIELLEDARSEIELGRRRAGGFGFGDLLRSARELLLDDPALARAERASFDALLVDEFQDTSRVQRDLVYALRERDDSGRLPGEPLRAEHLRREGLFLVGDRKQSIYAFRGADVAVFARTCRELCGRAAAEALALAPEPGDVGEPVADFVALVENRRAGARVLDFVNAFSRMDFAAASAHDFDLSYGPGDVIVPAPDAEKGDGEVVYLADDGTSPEGAAALVADANGSAREAHVAAAFVARGTRDGSFAPREVAILARRRSTIPLVELALARLDVPYVVAGRALYDTLEVRDVASLLRLLLDPADRNALAAVLRGPLVTLDDASLARLSLPGRGLRAPLGPRRDDPPELPPAERARLDAFRDRFARFAELAPILAPSEALRQAIEVFDFERVLAALPRASARLGNLDRLVAIARRQRGTLAAFSRWLDARIADETDEPEAVVFSPEDDAVRITTIHGSKGLAFPVVVLVDTNAGPRPATEGLGVGRDDGRPAFVMKHFGAAEGGFEANRSVPIVSPVFAAFQAEATAREQAERRRLAYVAITRAERILVMVGSAERPRSGTTFASLRAGIEAETLPVGTQLDARDLLKLEARSGTVAAVAAPALETAEPSAARESAKTLAVATTPLAVFDGCARRYRLRYLVGLDEPVATSQLDLFAPSAKIADDARGDRGEEAPPREVGRAAHRMLETWPLDGFGADVDTVEIQQRLVAEGLTLADVSRHDLAARLRRFLASPYAASWRHARDVLREAKFVLPVSSARGRTLQLRGAIDVAVRWDDGRIDVLDYKLAPERADLARHAFQLRSYALAVKRADPSAEVAAGVVFLGAEAPVWLGGDGGRAFITDAEHERFAIQLGALADRLADARATDRFPPIALTRCRALGCGFVAACHGRSSDTE